MTIDTEHARHAYTTSVVGEFLILGNSVFVTTGFENGFVLRFRILDGYSGSKHGSLVVMDASKMAAAKRLLRSEYLKLMEGNNISGWDDTPAREDHRERNAVIDFDKRNKITDEILKRRDKDGDPLSTERISKALLKIISID